jgi:hypothetical protein
MKTLKITIAVLASVLANAVVFAGELTVTGNAKATYALRSSDSTTGASENGKGIGIANEFTLSASGETDNGIAWKYAQDIDDATVQDDASLTLTFPTYGTLGIFVSEGGISSKYGWSPAVYAPGSDYGWTSSAAAGTTHDDGTSQPGFTYGNDIGGYNNFQYHTPAGILPFGLGAKVAWAPSSATDQNASSDNAGDTKAAADGHSVLQYQVNATPVDGLSVSASYIENDGYGTDYKQTYEAGGVSAKYSAGPVTIGYGKFLVAPAITRALVAQHTYQYENISYGIGFNVNENFSISYTQEKSEASKKTVTAGTRADAMVKVEAEISAVQAAYTMGGMTVSVASKSLDNIDYTANRDGTETVIAVALAF